MKKLIIAAALCTGFLGAQAAPLFEVPQQPVTQQAPAKKEVKKEHATTAHHTAMKARKAAKPAKVAKTEKKAVAAPARTAPARPAEKR